MNIDIKNTAQGANMPEPINSEVTTLVETPAQEQIVPIEQTQVLEEGMIPEIPQQDPRLNSNQKRFNELYHKAKEYDRARPKMEAMEQELQKLKQNMGNVNLSSINSELAQVQKSYEEALATQNHAGAAALNTKIMELTVAKTQATKDYFTPAIPKPVEAPNEIADTMYQQYQQPQIPQEVVMAAQIFEQNNPWYGTDPARTGAMNAIATALKDDPIWGQKSISTQLNESLRRVKAAFPHQFRQATPPASTAGVPTSGAGSNNAAAEDTLTPEEKQMAQMLNPRDPAAAEKELLKSKQFYKGRTK